MRSSDIARKWLDAISRQDRDAAIAVTADDIAIHGPDDIARGRAIIDIYFTDLRMRIEVTGLAERGETVAVRHHIDFLGADGGVSKSIDSEALMTVIGGKVASYRRANENDDLVTGFEEVPVSTLR